MNDTSSRVLLERLIGFATVSRDPNLEMIGFIRDYLAGFGVESELFYNAERTKASLYATIGPRDRGGIALSGHTDVVPVDGQAWTVEPFRLTERDGRLYGRGTADMKGFIASALAAVPAFVARPLRVPVHLAFSYDEEVGCLGVRPMLDALAARPHRPRLCLIGEPTELRPVLGHKGKLAMRCHVKGAACHSAYAPSGVNAIDYAESELLPRMRAVQPDTDIRLQPLGAYPGLATAPDSEAARLLAMLSGSDAFGTVAFGTEGGLFGQAGIPAVVCGPGSMDQGHKPDEFVTLDQLHGCDAMLRRLAAYLSSAA
ncbi:acetylornithine deacetylase [Burkholderia cepacia]|uniref:acetylornithine deacetylase n=1 Tax=Burkholderia cepacia TaxID=292 RepID=UPI001589F9D3|nr:acetylornithine deacetylase [Burkholderia cepacia]